MNFAAWKKAYPTQAAQLRERCGGDDFTAEQVFESVEGPASADALEQERDRVNAHLAMGTQTGDMDRAVAAIRAGDGMTVEHQSGYLHAAMNRQAIRSRQSDDRTAEQVLDGAIAQSSEGPDLGDQIVAVLDGETRGETRRKNAHAQH